MDVSSNFNKTKNKGAEIGIEQFKMDEETFENSVLVRQNQVAVDTSSQNSIIQKIGNAIQTGDESLSYDEIIKKLEKVLYDEVGTDRTTTKPKYTLKKEVSRLEVKQIELESVNNKSAELKKQKDELNETNIKLQHKLEMLRELQVINQKYEKELDSARIKYDIEQDAFNKQKEEKSAKNKKNKIITSIIILLIMALSIVALVYFKYYIFAVIALVVGIITLVINLAFFHKEEPEAIVKPFGPIEDEIKRKQSKDIKRFFEKRLIKKHKTEFSSSKLQGEINELERSINQNKLDIHKLKIEEDSIKDKANFFNEVVEDLECNKSELKKVLDKEEKINLGITLLKESYEEIKKKIIPSVEEDIKYTVSKTTNGKYSEIKYNDQDGLICKNEYGELIPLNKLSLGTVDQMYLGFRLAIADKYGNLPLIFDEAFVYYDDERLENILKTISDFSKEKQVLILSCSNREIKILEKLNINFNKVEL